MCLISKNHRLFLPISTPWLIPSRLQLKSLKAREWRLALSFQAWNRSATKASKWTCKNRMDIGLINFIPWHWQGSSWNYLHLPRRNSPRSKKWTVLKRCLLLKSTRNNKLLLLMSRPNLVQQEILIYSHRKKSPMHTFPLHLLWRKRYAFQSVSNPILGLIQTRNVKSTILKRKNGHSRGIVSVSRSVLPCRKMWISTHFWSMRAGLRFGTRICDLQSSNSRTTRHRSWFTTSSLMKKTDKASLALK